MSTNFSRPKPPIHIGIIYPVTSNSDLRATRRKVLNIQNNFKLWTSRFRIISVRSTVKENKCRAKLLIVSFLLHLFFDNHTKTEVDSYWFTEGSLVESSHIQESPRMALRSKCQQSPWGVDLKLEPNHRRNFDDAVVFSFFTKNKQTNTYEYYTLARVWFFSDHTIKGLLMMMIAFITIKSSLVPLIEGLCAQI